MYVSATAMTIISTIIVLLGVIIAFLTYKRGNIQDLIKEARENAIITTKLDSIESGVKAIQLKLESQQLEINDVRERVAKIEDSVKSAHNRINDLLKIREAS